MSERPLSPRLFSFLAAASALFLTTAVANAQVGKITGVVTDAQTGDPIVGAQVYLEGEGRGALSGDNGRYFLVNVPVGTYTVVTEMMGYAVQRLENVFLRIDQTRTLDFELTPQAIALDTINVVAEQVPLINVTATGSQSTITSAQITALPVNNIEEALQLQQGFLMVPDQTNLLAFSETRRNALTPIRIRGGRAGETQMLIDGIPVNNFIYGSPALSITPEAVGQIDFIRGGFPAQYGNALSGIINIATKEGSGTNLAGAINYRTGQVGAALGNDYDDAASFNLFEAYVAGPVPGTEWGAANPRLRFMIAGRQQGGADRALEFDDHVFDPSTTEDCCGFAEPFYMDVWPGWRGLGFDQQRDLFGKLSFYFTPTAKLNLTYIDYQRERKPYDFDFLPTYGNPLDSPIIDTTADSTAFVINRIGSITPPMGFPLVVENAIEQNRRLFVLAWDHTVGRGAYRIAAGRFDQNRLTCNVFQGVCLNEVIGEPVNAFADPNFNGGFIAPLAGTCETHPTCGADNFYGGETLETYVVRADAQLQATDHHSLQFGAYYERHDVSMDELQNYGVNAVRVHRLRYSAQPWNAAFYIQDLIEYDFMTVSLGLRFDFGQAGGLFFPNPLDPTNGTTAISDTIPGPGYSEIHRRQGPCVNPAGWQDVSVRYFDGIQTVDTVMSADPSWTRDVCLEDPAAIDAAALIASSDDFAERGTRSAVSPRLGVSFPVTATSSFFFNFGRFAQNPLLNNVYAYTGIGKDTTVSYIDADGNERTVTSSLEGTPTGVDIAISTTSVSGQVTPVDVTGNPNLVTEKATLYELGYLAELWENYALSLVLFSKDQTGLQGIRTGGIVQGQRVFDPGNTYGTSQPEYYVIVNQDFQTVRGLEISMRRRIVDYWGFDINYSLARAKTNAAAPEKEFERQIDQDDPRLLREVPSDIDQPQRLAATLFFQMGNETPSGWGWASNSSFSLVGRFETGFPYTPVTSLSSADAYQLERNSNRGPSVWTLDLRLAKAFWWGNMLYDLYFQVNNVMDRTNCVQVYPTSGTCQGAPDGSRERFGRAATTTQIDRPHYTGTRRSILAGLRLSF